VIYFLGGGGDAIMDPKYSLRFLKKKYLEWYKVLDVV